MCMNEVAEQPCGQKMAVEAGQNFLRELVWPLERYIYIFFNGFLLKIKVTSLLGIMSYFLFVHLRHPREVCFMVLWGRWMHRCN